MAQLTDRGADLAPARVKLKRRPALDGLRGFAVGACLIYQMFPSVFSGAWLGVDMFLTISGFFIAAMLLQELKSTGRIDYWRFLKRRARRLGPGQLTLFAAVLVATAFLMPIGRRADVAKDTVASLFEVANWRFVSIEASYFNTATIPSPLRHMWSLSVQEQYYIVFPLLLMGLLRISRKKQALYLLFGGLTLLSIGRMAALYVPGTDPSRVYFGTDTRIFEVLIGVLGAFLLADRAFAMSRGRHYAGWLHRWDHIVGWAGLASIVLLFAGMLTLTEYSSFLFPWGLVVVCVLTMIAIMGASSPTDTVMQRILSWSWLRAIGRMGLPLYLWHWPVQVFMVLAFGQWPRILLHTVSMGITVLLGVATHRWLEDPVHRRGLAGFLPGWPVLRRIVVLGIVPAILTGAAVVAGPVVEEEVSSDPGLVLTIPTYTPQQYPLPVMLMGNSIARGIFERRNLATAPDIGLGLIAGWDCDLVARATYEPTARSTPTPGCLEFQRTWDTSIVRDQRPVIALVMSPNLITDYTVDGKVVSAGDPAHDEVVRGILDEVRNRSIAAGAGGFMVFNFACRNRPDMGAITEITRSNDISTVRQVNATVKSWGDAHGVEVVDMFGALCPGNTFHEVVNGITLYDDGIHYSERSAPMIYSWMAPYLQAAAIRRGTPNSGVAVK